MQDFSALVFQGTQTSFCIRGSSVNINNQFYLNIPYFASGLLFFSHVCSFCTLQAGVFDTLTLVTFFQAFVCLIFFCLFCLWICSLFLSILLYSFYSECLSMLSSDSFICRKKEKFFYNEKQKVEIENQCILLFLLFYLYCILCALIYNFFLQYFGFSSKYNIIVVRHQ